MMTSRFTVWPSRRTRNWRSANSFVGQGSLLAIDEHALSRNIDDDFRFGGRGALPQFSEGNRVVQSHPHNIEVFTPGTCWCQRRWPRAFLCRERDRRLFSLDQSRAAAGFIPAAWASASLMPIESEPSWFARRGCHSLSILKGATGPRSVRRVLATHSTATELAANHHRQGQVSALHGLIIEPCAKGRQVR